MSDDKKRVGKQDDNLISFKQKYEIDYALKQLQNQFPNETKKAVQTALFDAAKSVSSSEGREKIMKQARKNILK